MVNPYDTESVADSIYYALKMNKEEKQQENACSAKYCKGK